MGQACQPVVVGPIDVGIQKLNADQRTQLTASFNTAYFVAKEELPFTMYMNYVPKFTVPSREKWSNIA